MGMAQHSKPQAESLHPAEKGRLDAVLVALGAASGREKARQLIEAGKVQVNGKTVLKPATQVTPADTITCDNSMLRYVGRGGYKLEKALDQCNLQVEGLTALDVGASTGGFTDCLLQRGAGRVYAVDVGHGQLHPSLQTHPKVVNLEGTDIRSPQAARRISEQADLAVVDVSFISLKLVIPSVLSFLKDGGTLICLVKPQFEAGPAHIGKGGIVRDKRVHVQVLQDILQALAEQHCKLYYLAPSPITGGDGNIEYLAVSTYLPEEPMQPATIPVKSIVEQAFS